MFGLIIRVALLAAVAFGVAFGISRALKSRAQARANERILGKIDALRAGLEAGLYSQDDYDRLRADLEDECRRLGGPVPRLPKHIKPGGSDS